MALIAMGLGVIVIANDFTALNVALPAIEEDFNVDVGTAQWVINAYCLVFGMAIVTGGRLADLFGRRRAFFVGSALFAGFSLLGGLAQDAPWLIAARVGMGIGGALMWPAILGMTYAALPESKAGLAGGLILGAAGIGNAMGPLLGGVLTDALSWRWIFFLNVPIAAFAVLVTWLKVHQPRPEVEDQRIDYPGIVTLSTGLLLVLLAFDQAADWGFGDARVIAMLAVAVAPGRRLRADRAADEAERPGPGGRVPQRRVSLRLPDRAADVGGLLRHRALRAAVHGEDPRLLGARGRARDGADARHLRPRLLLRRPAVPAAGRRSRRSRSAPPGSRSAPSCCR